MVDDLENNKLSPDETNESEKIISPEKNNSQEQGKEIKEKEEEKKKKPKIRKPLDQNLLEALFFASGRPITVNRIAIEFGWQIKEAIQPIKDLATKLARLKKRGILE